MRGGQALQVPARHAVQRRVVQRHAADAVCSARRAAVRGNQRSEQHVERRLERGCGRGDAATVVMRQSALELRSLRDARRRRGVWWGLGTAAVQPCRPQYHLALSSRACAGGSTSTLWHTRAGGMKIMHTLETVGLPLATTAAASNASRVGPGGSLDMARNVGGVKYRISFWNQSITYVT